MAKSRLYVEQALAIDAEITLSGDAHHYLARVMRLGVGDQVELFDGNSDAVNARIIQTGKRDMVLVIETTATSFRRPPDVTLAFAPIKKARTDFIVEKAAEMGMRHIQPILTEYTNSERVRIDRLHRHAIEAAEQCGGTYVPSIAEPMKLADLLTCNNGQLLFCDETADNGAGQNDFSQAAAQSWTILIGPEGGFSNSERTTIRGANAIRLSLGPRILRADTAAVAAMTLWQTTHGDWS